MSKMDLASFLALIEARGADPARWPEADRAAALALLDTSPEARARVEDEAALDGLLGRVPAPLPSERLQADILAAAMAEARPAAAEAPGGTRAQPDRAAGGFLSELSAALAGLWPALKPVPVLGLALVVGLAAGIAAPTGGAAREAADELAIAEAYVAGLLGETGPALLDDGEEGI